MMNWKDIRTCAMVLHSQELLHVFQHDDVSTCDGFRQKSELLGKQQQSRVPFPVHLFFIHLYFSAPNKCERAFFVWNMREADWYSLSITHCRVGGFAAEWLQGREWLQHPFAPPSLLSSLLLLLSVCLTSYTFKAELTGAVCMSC